MKKTSSKNRDLVQMCTTVCTTDGPRPLVTRLMKLFVNLSDWLLQDVFFALLGMT
jgi:hypothetical protein